MIQAKNSALPRSIGEWQSVVADAFLPLSLQSSGRSFDMRARLGYLGSLRVAEINCSGHRAVRSRRQAEQSDTACYKIIWQLAGQSRIEQNGHSTTLSPDQWLIYDTAQPYAVECSERAEFVALLSPAADNASWRQFIEANGGLALPTRGTSRLALHTLQSALQHSAELDTEGVRGAECATRSLLASTFRQRMHECAATVSGRRAKLLLEAEAYIDRNRSNPDLTPGRLADSLHVSRRTLYNLFNGRGTTPNARILDARLEGCRNALADPLQAHKSITRIADEHGFSDSAHFSRVFKNRFGVNPMAYRQSRIY